MCPFVVWAADGIKSPRRLCVLAGLHYSHCALSYRYTTNENGSNGAEAKCWRMSKSAATMARSVRWICFASSCGLSSLAWGVCQRRFLRKYMSGCRVKGFRGREDCLLTSS